MVCQTRIVFSFLDEALRARPLAVEPRQHGDAVAHIGDEHAIAVLRCVKQLILLWLLLRGRLLLLDVAQGDEPMRLAPALRLITEFALPPGIRLLRRLPLGLA